MKKRIFGVWSCLFLLCLGSAAQAQLQTIEPKKWYPIQFQFSQNGQRLLAVFLARPDKTGKPTGTQMTSWDVESGRQLSCVLHPAGKIGSYPNIIFSPDGRLYYQSLTSDPTVRVEIKNTATGQAVSELKGKNLTIRPVAFSADGKLVAAGFSHNQAGSSIPLSAVLRHGDKIGFWNTRTGKQVPRFVRESELEYLDKVLFSRDNRLVVRLGTKGDGISATRPWAAVYNRKTGKRLKAFFFERYNLDGYNLSPDGRYLAGIPYVWEKVKQIPVWDMQTGKQLYLLDLKPTAPRYVSLHFSADSQHLTAFTSIWQRYYNYHLSGPPYARQVWSTASGQEMSHTRLPLKPIYPPVDIHSIPTASTTSNRFYARFTNEDNIELLSLESWELVREIRVELGF